jgi:hypothetical protein
METSSNLKRRDKDIAKLLMSNYDVLIADENKRNEIFVVFKGPSNSPYENVSLKIK